MGGLRILSIGGVCLLKVIAGSEGRNEFYFLCSFHRSKKKKKKENLSHHSFQFHIRHIFDSRLTQPDPNRACLNPTHSSVSPTWSSVAHPCSSGDRRAAAGRAAPASPRQKHSAAPAAAHSSPPGLQTQAHPGGGEKRSGHQHRYIHSSTVPGKYCDVLLTHLTATVMTYNIFLFVLYLTYSS